MNPQPLTKSFIMRCVCPDCQSIMGCYSHGCPSCKAAVVEADEVWSQQAIDDVRAAVEYLQFQYAALSGLAASEGNIEAEKAYDTALARLNEIFPAFADEKKDSVPLYECGTCGSGHDAATCAEMCCIHDEKEDTQ